MEAHEDPMTDIQPNPEPTSHIPAVPLSPAPGRSHNNPREGTERRSKGRRSGLWSSAVWSVSSAQQQTWVWVLQIRTGVSAGRCGRTFP